MRNRLLILFCVVALVLSCLYLTGCYHEETVDGLTYVDAKEYFKKVGWSNQYEDYLGDADGYACRIETDAPADVKVPDDYNGKPVVFVTMDTQNENTALRSITVGKNVLAICNIISLGSSPNLEQITMTGSIRKITPYPWQYSDFVLRIEGEIKDTAAFFEKAFEEPLYRMNNLRIVVDRQEYAESIKNNMMQRMEQDHWRYQYYQSLEEDEKDQKYTLFELPEVGTPETFAYSDKVDKDALCAAARQCFGKELDESKKISEKEAASYRDQMDGPLVMSKEISEKQFEYISEADPEYVSIAYMSLFMDDYIKTDREPDVYCVVERALGPSNSYGFSKTYSGSPADYVETYYHTQYRISLRKIEDNELICWFETTTGSAPDKTKMGSRDIGVLIGDKYHLCETDGYYLNPVKVVSDRLKGQ